MKKAIFIDKDGTLIPDIPFNVDPEKITLVKGAVHALRELQSLGYLLILVSNQSGVAHGFFPESALLRVRERVATLLSEGGVHLNGAYFCPHHPEGIVEPYNFDCECRKPKPGMIKRAALDYQIDLKQSWMIGDILHDIEAGNRAGCKTILINNGNETEWVRNEFRFPTNMAPDLPTAAELILQSHLKQAEV